MPEARELKKEIESRSVREGLHVLSGNAFLAEQYAKAIAGDAWYPSDGLDEAVRDGLDPDAWAIVRCGEFDSPMEPEELAGVGKAIVICGKASKKASPFETSFPDPEEWQVEAFAESLAPGVAKEKLKWMCEQCGHNPWRIESECAKMGAFPREMQDEAFDMLDGGDAFSDLGEGSAFDLANAVSSRDIAKLTEVMRGFSGMDVSPMGLVQLLLKAFGNLISLQMDPFPTAKKCGMTEKQFNFLRRRDVGKWGDAELVSAYAFLSSYESRLKSGELPMSDANAVAYVVAEAMGGRRRGD